MELRKFITITRLQNNPKGEEKIKDNEGGGVFVLQEHNTGE